MKGPFKDIIAGHQVWVLEDWQSIKDAGGMLRVTNPPDFTNIAQYDYQIKGYQLSELTEDKAREIGFGGYIINPATQEEELAHCKEHLIDVLTQALKAKGINVRVGERPKLNEYLNPDPVSQFSSNPAVCFDMDKWKERVAAWDNSPGLEHIIIEKI